MESIARLVWLPVPGCLLVPAGSLSPNRVKYSERVGLEDVSLDCQLLYAITQRTRSYIEITRDGSEAFSNLMGGIYRLQSEGGVAVA